LTLFAWTNDFIPSTMKNNKTQAWVRIYNLPLEYWRSSAIFFITRGISTLFSLDDHTMKTSSVFFARVLVDIGLLSFLSNKLLVERSGFAFITDVEYE